MMRGLLTRARLARVAGFASAQVGVQLLAFGGGIVLVRAMAPAEYGFYTLGVTMVGVANVLTELGLANAVIAIGGRLPDERAVFARLLSDAHALHAVLAFAGLAVVLPAFALLMRHQHAPVATIVALSLAGGLAAILNVRNAIALALARLAGHLGVQQRMDLVVNGARLLVLAALALVALDAVVASIVNLAVAAGAFVAWRGYLARRFGGAVAVADPGRRAALRMSVLRQAPNCVYYVFSSQLAVWLIGIFGTTDRVADVGALGRLGAAFAVVTAVIGAVVQPYFARRQAAAELDAAFVVLNASFLGLTLALAGLSVAYPEAFLWILGPHYAGLRRELVWMALSTALAAWGGALYTVGCGRGWVLPSAFGIGCGVVSTIVGLSCFDLSTVGGSLELATLSAAAAMAVNFAYMSVSLARHRRSTRGLQPAQAR